MKNRVPLLALVGFLFVGLVGCLKDECTTTRTFTRFDPVYKSVAEIRTGIAAQLPRTMKNPGKIYYYQNYLLVNEIREGIHVFDNSDPANPKPVVFWSIPGNVDMAILGNHLYADQYVDLLTLDISDFQNPTVSCRAENVFQLYGYDPYRGWLVEYAATEVTETLKCSDDRTNQNWWWGGNGGIFIDVAFDNTSGGPTKANNSASSALSQATGVSGSFARFCFVGPYLYGVDNSTLYPFDLANPACPSKLEAVPVGWNIETIFPFKDRLFLGSQTGVFIYNATNPRKPVYESGFTHATGCDPVVCDENYAFVTVHDGTACNGSNINSLDIVGISALPATALLKSYSMTRPLGLGLAGNLLFLADDGLKIFDRSDIQNLKLLSHTKGVKAWDVIALSESHLLVVGEGGFYQFDTSDPANPKQISHMAVN